MWIDGNGGKGIKTRTITKPWTKNRYIKIERDVRRGHIRTRRSNERVETEDNWIMSNNSW